MKQAVGRWLLFADADDFFHSDMLRMLDEYKDSDSDLILFETDSVDSQTLRPVPSRTGIIAGLDEGMLRHGVRRAPWGKMVLRDLVERNKIRFEAVPASNDVLFSAYVGHLAHKVSVSSEILYCSTVRNDSLWYGMRREHLLVRIEVACRLAHLLRDWHESDRYRIYAYDFVKRSRAYGVKAYMTALCLYLRKERWHNIWCDFYNLVKVKYLKT